MAKSRRQEKPSPAERDMPKRREPVPSKTAREAKKRREAKALAAAAAPVVPARKITPCTECGKCCTYVAIEIDEPNSVKRATLMLWYLYHENMSLYRDDDMWLVQFETRCRNLTSELHCGVYPVRPHICRDFSEVDCEVNSGDDGETYKTPAQFLEHMQRTRPRIYAKLAAGYARPQDVQAAAQSAARRKLPVLSAGKSAI